MKRLKEGKGCNMRMHRKDIFKTVKRYGESLVPVLDTVFDALLLDNDEHLTNYLLDVLLDMQELLKASICKGRTILHDISQCYDAQLDFLYKKFLSISNKVKLTAVKIAMYDCFTYDGSGKYMPEVAYVSSNELLHPVEEIFNIMVKDKKLHGQTLLSLENEVVFSIFSEDLSKVVFFNQKLGIILETKVEKITVLQRKDLLYIAHRGKDHS